MQKSLSKNCQVKQAVILAAGESSRFWPQNQRHKSLFKICGRPLLSFILLALKKSGIKEVIVIQGPKKDVEKELEKYHFPGLKIKYAVQKEPKATGNAVWQARKLVFGPFVVLWPYKIDAENYLPQLLKKFEKERGKPVLLAAKTEQPWDYGILKFKGEKIVEIVENPEKGREPSNIAATGTYVLPLEFFDFYKKVSEREEILIDVINLLIKERGAEYVLWEGKSVSLKYPWHLFDFLDLIFSSKDFKNYISPSAQIPKNVIIKGKMHIGKNVQIGDNTVIEGPCFLGDNCKIGINNLILGPVVLESDVITGAFFEIKHSLVSEGTHFHSGFVGDSIIGRNCRFGAGFVTANRRIDRGNIKPVIKGKKLDSGLTYFGLVVGDNTRFGIQCGTMPGVFVGSNCVVGPGSLVFENIEDNKTLYSKFNFVARKK